MSDNLSIGMGVDTNHPQYTKKIKPVSALVTAAIAGEMEMIKRLPFPLDREVRNDDRIMFENYKKRAAFVNATRRTLNSWVGIVLATPVKYENMAAGKIGSLTEDIDGNGMSLDQMIRDGLAEVLSSGRAALVPVFDAPYTVGADGQIEQTKEQASSGTLKVNFYPNEHIINWRTSNGRDSLVVFRKKEQINDDEFSFRTFTTWREFRMVEGKAYTRLWWSNDESVPPLSTNTEGFSTTANNSNSGHTDLSPLVINGEYLDYLPIFWIGAVNNDSFPDDAPLYDIASLNEKHYMAEAGIANLADKTALPTVVISGVTKTEQTELKKTGVQMGSNTAVVLSEKGNFDIVQAEERNLCLALAERREKQMAAIGAQIIDRGSAPKTATEADYDAQTDNSALSLVASNVESAFNKAISHLAGIVGTGQDGKYLTINKRYTSDQIDSQALTAMLATVNSGKMTVNDFVSWCVRSNVIDANGRTTDQIAQEIKDQEPSDILNFSQSGGNDEEDS